MIHEISHKYIIKAFEFFERPTGGCVLITEYFDFPDLKHYIVQWLNFQEENTLRNIARKILKALKYLHETIKICHRDIKPKNILVSHDEKFIKILDFGVAKSFQDQIVLDPKLTPMLMMTPTGTPDYKAPEMLIGGTFSEKIDIWALGVTLFELVARKSELQSKIRKLISTISKDANEFIFLLLQTNPAYRPSANDALKSPWLKTINNPEEIIMYSQIDLLSSNSTNFDNDSALLQNKSPYSLFSSPINNQVYRQKTQQRKVSIDINSKKDLGLLKQLQNLEENKVSLENYDQDKIEEQSLSILDDEESKL